MEILRASESSTMRCGTSIISVLAPFSRKTKSSMGIGRKSHCHRLAQLQRAAWAIWDRRELQYNRLVEQEIASDEAYEILESRLIFARIKYISETYQENWGWTFRTYKIFEDVGRHAGHLA